MGAQAAALLDAAATGAPLGAVQRFTPAGTLRLDAPQRFDLRRTALVHAGVGLAPTGWDGARLHLRLPGPVVVGADLEVAWRDAPPDAAALRRVLALDDDLEPLWSACDDAGMGWVRETGSGRLLHAPTVWQELVLAVAQVRSSYRGAQARVRSLVGDGPFPTPADVAARDELPGWGFRAPWVLSLARSDVDLERLRDPRQSDDEVAAALRALPGVGPFTAAQLLPLLGRPRPLVLDGWLRTQLGDRSDAELAARYALAGRWAGTAAWLDAVRGRLR